MCFFSLMNHQVDNIKDEDTFVCTMGKTKNSVTDARRKLNLKVPTEFSKNMYSSTPHVQQTCQTVVVDEKSTECTLPCPPLRYLL